MTNPLNAVLLVVFVAYIVAAAIWLIVLPITGILYLTGVL